MLYDKRQPSLRTKIKKQAVNEGYEFSGKRAEDLEVKEKKVKKVRGASRTSKKVKKVKKISKKKYGK